MTEIKNNLINEAISAFKKGFSTDAKGQQMEEYSKNLKAYSNKKKEELLGYLNFPIPNMSGFVDTYVSRMPRLKFIFKANKSADNQAVERVNAMAERDRGVQFANYDKINRGVNKIAVLSGVGIFKIYSNSVNGYKHYLHAVDPFNFFCQPYGGSDLEKHQFCGEAGIMKTESELKEGVESGIYNREEVDRLISFTAEDKTAFDKFSDRETESQKRFKILGIQSNDSFLEKTYSLVEAYITVKGIRYYCLFEPKSRAMIRQAKLTDIFESNLYPYCSFSPKEDINNFWAIAPATDVRPVCDAQAELVNEIINNNRKINRPTRVYDPNALTRPPQYIPDQWIGIKTGFTKSINDAYSIIQTPNIVEQSMRIVDFLDNIQSTKSGITPGVQGSAETDKVGINQMNLYQSATRQDYQNESHEECVKQMGIRYLAGLSENLTDKISVMILGKKGLEAQFMTKEDAQLDYDVDIEDINKKLLENQQDLVIKQWALSHKSVIEGSNQKKLQEEVLKLAKYEGRDIKEFQEEQYYSTREQLENSENAFNKILEGKKPKVYKTADIIFCKNFFELMTTTDGIPPKKMPMLETYLQAHLKIAGVNQKSKAMFDMLLAENTMAQQGLQQIPPMEGENAPESQLNEPQTPTQQPIAQPV